MSAAASIRFAFAVTSVFAASALVGCDDAAGGGGSAASSASGSAGGAGGDGGGTCQVDTSYAPTINPSDFEDGTGTPLPVDNALYPLVPGTIFTYREGQDQIVLEVTKETKVILGVTCVVVHDAHRDENGALVEDTLDWFAQDADGNVWYFGEDTKEYENGVVTSTEGSWEAGVEGAKPGITMPAKPSVGDNYRQEYYACHAEDVATVIDVDASVSVAMGDFTGCVETYDYSAIDPLLDELKFYCPNVGFVLAITLSDASREGLESVRR